jgi:hypothetical protein
MLLIGIPDNQRAASAPAKFSDVPLENAAIRKRTLEIGIATTELANLSLRLSQ